MGKLRNLREDRAQVRAHTSALKSKAKTEARLAAKEVREKAREAHRVELAEAKRRAKLEKKKAYRHSGYPGGLRAQSYEEMLEKHPTRAVEKAIRGMLPKNALGRQQLKKLKVYAGAEHPHAAQQPVPFEISQVAQ